MSDATREADQRLLGFFRTLNRFMLALWRLGLGGSVNAWPSVGGRIMVLTQVGRKTGFRRRTPLNYVVLDGDVYCTAGFGSGSDWYRNILANPEVEIWLPAATEEYRLLRITRSHGLTGRGGPGDLAWIWPLATMILLLILLF